REFHPGREPTLPSEETPVFHERPDRGIERAIGFLAQAKSVLKQAEEPGFDNHRPPGSLAIDLREFTFRFVVAHLGVDAVKLVEDFVYHFREKVLVAAIGGHGEYRAHALVRSLVTDRSVSGPRGDLCESDRENELQWPDLHDRRLQIT